MNDELKASKKLNKLESLIKVRESLESKNLGNYKFCLQTGEVIQLEEENNYKLIDILKGNQINIQKVEKSQLNQNPNLNLKKEKIIIDIFVNDQLISSKKLNVNDNIVNIRTIIKKNLSNDFQFLLPNNLKIDVDEEEDYILKDILINNNRINLFTEKTETYLPLENQLNTNSIQKKQINKPIENSKFIIKKDNLDIYLYPELTFSKEEIDKSIKIMVIGPTGSGKTTLLNSYINYLMEVNYIDTFRYIIINETKKINDSNSQTSEVTNYNIKAKNGKLYQIIDTPGFGDTEGIKKDEEITIKISNFFLYKINEINAVCLVLKSSDNRLASCQKYIFNCIFDLFGDDMKKVFLAMLTFCDGGKPQVISALTDENCLFSQFLFSIGKDWYYKFNNSAIFEKNEEDILNLTYWNIGMNSFKNFTEKINTLPAINLDKTRRVLEIRSLLVSTIEILSYKLREGLNKIDELKGIYKIIQNLKGDINDSRNYTQTQKITREKEVPVASGVYMTTCLRCSETCHRNCQISDDDYKDGCKKNVIGKCIKIDHMKLFNILKIR